MFLWAHACVQNCFFVNLFSREIWTDNDDSSLDAFSRGFVFMLYPSLLDKLHVKLTLY
uniref:Uncharacterized protein n=1 Tax=Rhizophora mucronata TaxID=61149 RepID=A0A2P2NS09_RHIMU